MWYVYIIQCKDGTLYTGITNDLERRVSAHNAGRGGHFTKARRPVELVYNEGQPGKSEALKREIEIKKLQRKGKLALIKSFNASS